VFLVPSSTSLIPSRCNVASSSSAGGSEQMFCRADATTYAAQPALGAAGRDFLLSPTESATVVKVSGGSSSRYVVATAPIAGAFAGFTAHLVITIPERELTGRVVDQTAATAGIVAAIVVVAIIITFVALRRLLEPLRALERRMQMATALEDDDQPSALSLTTEIASIEAAYYQMNHELQRLKGFVSQSILVRNPHRRRIIFIKERIRTVENTNDLVPWYKCGCLRDPWAEADEEYDITHGHSHDSHDDNDSTGTLHEEMDDGNNDAANKRGEFFAYTPATSHNSNSGISGIISLGDRSNSRRARDASAKFGVSAGGQQHDQPRAGGMPQGASSGATSVRLASVVAINMVGFHGVALRDSAARLVSISEALTSLVVHAVGEERGVVDSFHGDHFLLTFNVASSCAAHIIRASVCALRIGQRAAGAFGELGLRIAGGVATSPVRLGNLGCKDSRRFSIVGAAVPKSFVLEGLVRRHPREAMWRLPAAGPYRIAVGPSLLEDLRAHVIYECVDIAVLPAVGAVGATRAAVPFHHVPQQHNSAMGFNPGFPNSMSFVGARAQQYQPPAPALTMKVVITQLLGEVATTATSDEEEWMYAIGDGAAGASTMGNHARVQRRLGANDLAAIRDARAILLRGGGAAAGAALAGASETTAVEEVRGSRNALRSPSPHATSGAVAGSPGHVDFLDFDEHFMSTSRRSAASAASGGVNEGGRIPLAESNRIFMLIADVARLRDRGILPTVVPQSLNGPSPPAAANVGSLVVGASLGVMDPAAESSESLLIETTPAGAAAPALTSPRVGALPLTPAVAAVNEKVMAIDAALRSWEAQYVAMTGAAQVQILRALLAQALGMVGGAISKLIH
jgi:class 3 adenylate cyclase